MQKFDRGNLITLSATFAPSTGTAQPTSAEAVLVFTDPNGDPASSTVNMEVDANGIWSGRWDSDACGGGEVQYVMRCDGPLKAATQGKFVILANKANSPLYN